MSRYEWLLFLHVASAFAFVAAYAVLTTLLIAGRRVDNEATARALLRVARPADALAWIGATGTLVFGTWLVVDVDAYELWDAWIVGAFALWLVAEEAIRREDLLFRKAQRAARAPLRAPRAEPTDVRTVLRSPHALLLHVLGAGALFGTLVLMIFKPGAA